MRKPFIFLLISLGYLVVVGFAKWFLHPVWSTLWFMVGGMIGIYLLDAAEKFTKITPSPFRSIVFAGAFVVVSLFIVTSTNNMLADGLVLSLFLRMLLWQLGEWQMLKNLNSWYRMIEGPVSLSLQKWGMMLFGALFLIETLIFLRFS